MDLRSPDHIGALHFIKGAVLEVLWRSVITVWGKGRGLKGLAAYVLHFCLREDLAFRAGMLCVREGFPNQAELSKGAIQRGLGLQGLDFSYESDEGDLQLH